MHCQWMPRSIVETLEQGKQRLQRFHQKFTVESFAGMDDGDYFNQDYLEVERIVDSKIHYRKRLYLVKWKMLPYEEATWELASDVADTQKIKQFNQFKKVPTVAERRIPLRPPAKAFKKMEQSPSFKNDNQLREYQLEGLNWLVFCWYNRRNSILADEMGLGKTVQTVAMLEYLRRVQHNRGPFLIIAPLSTIPHWQREFENWSEMNAIVFHGSSRSRDMIRQYEWTYRDSRGKVVPRVRMRLFFLFLLLYIFHFTLPSLSVSCPLYIYIYIYPNFRCTSSMFSSQRMKWSWQTQVDLLVCIGNTWLSTKDIASRTTSPNCWRFCADSHLNISFSSQEHHYKTTLASFGHC